MAIGIQLPAALALFAVGLFHGAADAVNGRVVRPGWGYSLIYLVLLAIGAAFFVAAPINGLLIFFGLSAWHFAQEERARAAPMHAAIGEGLALIGLPFLLRPDATMLLLEQMGTPWPGLLLPVMQGAGILGLLGLLVGGRHVRAAVLAMGYAILDPLLAVAVHFTALHAMTRLRELAPEWRGAWRLLAPFGLLALFGGGAILFAYSQGWIDALHLTALALAALIPHMLLDRTWGEGWGGDPATTRDPQS